MKSENAENENHSGLRDRLTRALARSDSEAEVLAFYHSHVEQELGDVYGQLWIVEEEGAESLLLVSEWGNRSGASIGPEDCRLELGKGIVGDVAASGRSLWLDMSDEVDLALAASKEFIRQEQIGRVFTSTWDSPPRGVVMLGARSDKGSPSIESFKRVASLAENVLAAFLLVRARSLADSNPGIVRLKRITKPTRAVLEAFMATPTDEQYGLDIAAVTGLKSGSLYPILGRLEDNGWLTSYWEDTNPETEGRPRRRYYKLTGDGIVLAVEALSPADGKQWVVPGLAT